MITKLLHFPGQDDQGNVFVERLLPSPKGLVKTASPVHPSILNFMSGANPASQEILVLVNALGATGVWPQNVNGDVWPEWALRHAPPDFESLPVFDVGARRKAVSAMAPQYGYATFYHAHPFTHHVNKDPEKSFGEVVFSVWNDHMKRVELVVVVDREKAKRVGADSVVEKLDNGEYPDVSMGCKVPWDQCTVCGHRARVRKEYCRHATNMMGEILPNGLQVGVINWFPRFFDISFVFVGADRTAKVMAKLADGDQIFVKVPQSFLYMPSAERAEAMGYNGGLSLEKAASLIPGMDARRISKRERRELESLPDVPKELALAGAVAGQAAGRALKVKGGKQLGRLAATRLSTKLLQEKSDDLSERLEDKLAELKLSEIQKEVLPDISSGKVMDVISGREPDMPTSALDSMAGLGNGSKGMSELLSTLGLLGLLLKPREFQRVMLIRIGHKPMADDLDLKGKTFGPVDDVDRSIEMGPEHLSDVIKELVLPLISERSFVNPPFRRRAQKLLASKEKTAMAPRLVEERNEILDKVSAAYNGYRLGLIDLVPDIKPTIESDPELLEAFYGEDFADAFADKTAEAGPVFKRSLPLLLALGPLIYMSASHWKAQQEMGGQKLPLTKRLIANHPYLASALAIGGGGRLAVEMDSALAKAVARAMA